MGRWTVPGAVDRGPNFQEQWDRALTLDPPFVMVTGWNEWIAGRCGKPGGPVVFVDQFNRGVQPRHRADERGPWRQLLLSARGQRPALQGGRADPPRLGAPIDPDRRRHATSGPTLRRSSPTTRATPLRATSTAPVACTTATIPAATIWWRSRSPGMPSNVYFYARTRQPLTPLVRPQLDVAAHRRRWQSQDRLGGLRLHRQPPDRRRRHHLAREERRRLEMEARRRRSRIAPPATNCTWRSRANRWGFLATKLVSPWTSNGPTTSSTRRHHGLLRQRRRGPRGAVPVSLRRGMR